MIFFYLIITAAAEDKGHESSNSFAITLIYVYIFRKTDDTEVTLPSITRTLLRDLARQFLSNRSRLIRENIYLFT